MRIPKIKTVSSCDQGDTVFIFIKPFYYDDVTQSLGLDPRDYLSALDKVNKANEQNAASSIKWGKTISKVIFDANQKIQGFKDTVRSVGSNQVVNITVSRDAEGKIQNVTRTIETARKSLEGLSEETAQLSAHLANLGAGGIAPNLKNLQNSDIIKNFVDPSRLKGVPEGLINNARVAESRFKSVTDNLLKTGKITRDELQSLFLAINTGTLDQIPVKIQRIGKEAIGAYTNLVSSLRELRGTRGAGLTFVKEDPTDIVRASVTSKQLAAAPAIDVSKAYDAQRRFKEVIDDLVSSGRLSKEELETLFSHINTGDLNRVPLLIKEAGAEAVIAYERLGKAISRVRGASTAPIETGLQGKTSQALIREHFTPEYLARRTNVDKFQATLGDQLDISNVTRKTEEESTRYQASIVQATQAIKGLKVDPEQFDEVFRHLASGGGVINSFTRDQSRLFDILLRVRNALDGVGKSAETMGANINAGLANITKGRDISLQFKGLLGNIPTGVSRSLETQLSRSINRVGEVASTNDINVSLDKVKEISNNVAAGIVTDWTEVGTEFKDVAREILKAHQLLAQLRETQAAKVSKVPYLPQARQLVDLATPQQLSIATPEEKARLTRDTEALIGLFSRLDNVKVPLKRFEELLSVGMTGAINNFEGKERQLYTVIQKVLADIDNLGASERAKLTQTATLTGREQFVGTVATAKIGAPAQLRTDVPTLQVNRLNSAYDNLIRKISRIAINVDDTGVNNAVDAALKGRSAFTGLESDIRALANEFYKLIGATNAYDVANTQAINKADILAKKLSSNVSSPVSARRLQATAQLVREGDQTRDPLITQLKGGIPLHATTGDVSRISAQVRAVEQLVASAKVSLRDYDNAIDLIRNKRLLPADASEDFRRLYSSIGGVSNQLDIAEKRADSFGVRILGVANTIRLLAVSELYTLYGSIRQLFDQAVQDANKLSIQIGQIRAITQDAIAPTQEWVDSLREISDAAGVDVVQVSAAAYDALSNQITRSKEDTKEFLTTATEFGRTVGATPAEAVNLLSSAINAYGKSAADATQLSSEFFAVIDIGRIRAQDLQNIYGRAAIAGAKLGVTTSEMGAALAVLTQNGLTTEDAITRLNNLFVKLINPTKEMDNLFKQFGITSPEQLIAINGFAGAIQRIEGSIRNGNVALDELFPEIRTLAGFLGLTGQNAIKFADAIEQVSNGTEKFRQAIKETTDIPIGQRFNVEIQKIKNSFLDLGATIQQKFVEFSETIGGLSNVIKGAFSFLGNVGKVVGPILAAVVAIRGLIAVANFAKLALAGLFALPALGISGPIGLTIAGIVAAILVLKAAIDHTRNSSTVLGESLSKLGKESYLNSEVKLNIDKASANAKKLADTLTKELTRASGQAAANANRAFDYMIERQKHQLEGLTERLKSSFDDVSNIVGKTISSIENYPKEIGAIRRKAPARAIELQEGINTRELQQRLTLQERIDQNVGFQTPTPQQAGITNQLANVHIEAARRAARESKRLLEESYNPSEAEAEHEVAINKLRQAEEQLFNLQSRINDSVVAGQAPLLSVNAINLQRKNILQEIVSLEREFASASRDSQSKIASQLEPMLQLKGAIQDASKEILRLFDYEKISKIGDITDDKGKVTKGRDVRIKEEVFQPSEKIFSDIEAKVQQARSKFNRAGQEEIDTAFNLLKQNFARLQSSRVQITQDIISKSSFERSEKRLDDFVKYSTTRISQLERAISALNTTASNVFGDIAKIGGTLPEPDIAIQSDFTKVAKNLDNLRRQASQPFGPAFINNISAALSSTNQAIDEAFKHAAELQLPPPNLDNIKRGLTTIQELIEKSTRITLKQEDFDTERKSLLDNIKRIKDEFGKSIPEVLKQNEAQFAEWFSHNRERFGDLIKDANTLAEAINKITKSMTFAKPPLAPNTTQLNEPTLTQKAVAEEEKVSKQKEEAETARFNLQRQLYKNPEQPIVRPPRAVVPEVIPSVPTPIVPTTPTPSAPPGVAVPVTETTGGLNASNDLQKQMLQSINRLVELQEKSQPNIIPNIPEAISEVHSTGGLVRHYRDGGFVSKGTDNIKAMLSEGEYVVPEKQTKKYHHILEKIRKDTYYQEGGVVESNIYESNIRRVMNEFGTTRQDAIDRIKSGETDPNLPHPTVIDTSQRPSKPSNTIYRNALNPLDFYSTHDAYSQWTISKSYDPTISMDQFVEGYNKGLYRLTEQERNIQQPYVRTQTGGRRGLVAPFIRPNVTPNITSNVPNVNVPDTIYRNALNPLDFYARHDAYSRWTVSKSYNPNINMDQFMEGYNKGLYRLTPEELSRRQPYIRTQASTYAAVPSLLRNQHRVSPLNVTAPHRNILTRVSPNAPNTSNRNIPNISNIIPNIPIKNVNLYNKVKTLKTLFPSTSLANIYRMAISYKAEGGFADDPKLTGYRPRSPGLNYNQLGVPVNPITGIIDLSKLNLSYGFQRGGEVTQKSYNELYRFFEKNPETARTLLPVHDLEPRYSLVGDLIKKGYPEGVITDASYRLYSGQNYRNIPNIEYDPDAFKASYNPSQGIMTLPSKDTPLVAFDRLSVMRHEMEHVNQFPRPSFLGNVRSTFSDLFVDQKARESAAEIPPFIEDIAHTAELYRQHTHENANIQARIGNKYVSVDWMAKQARQHGFFKGRNATQLFATPSGKAYLKYLASEEKSRGGVVGYQDGGTVEEHVNRLSSQWNSNKNISLDSVSTEPINKILLGRPDRAYSVSDHLYEKSIPRKEIVRSARLLSGKDTIPASVSLLSQMWKGRSPNIRIEDSNISSKGANSVSISNKSNNIVIDQISALSHELEHSKQIVKTIAPPRGSSEETKDTFSDIGSISKELPASVGDIAFTAKSYELTNKKPLDVPVRVSPYVTHNASWMAAQAEKQGYFQGRSMTELLSTPSGQAYTKRLLGYQDGGRTLNKLIDSNYYQEGGIVNDREKFLKLKASNKYDWNWNLINDKMQTESLHKVLETLYNFDDSRVNYQEGGRVDERLINNLTSYWRNIGGDTNSLTDNTLQRIFSETPQASFRLGEFLHDKEISLGRIATHFDRFSQTDIDKTSARVLSSMYRGKAPDIQYTPGGGEYLHKENKITLESDRSNLHPYVSNLGVLRHELEHSQQNAPYPRVSREQDFFTRINKSYTEIPATLGNIPFHAEVYKHLAREPLIKPVEVAPGVVHSPNFMADIAKQHGFFRGRTTTELMSTTSGQAYTRRLLESTREYNNPQGTLGHQHLYDRNPQQLKMLQLPPDKREEAIKKYYGLNTGGIVNYYDSGGMSNPPPSKKPVGNMEDVFKDTLNETSYYAKGGWTWFQPKGTDTIPAMLTPGEYVMPQKMTEKYLPILQKMREGRYEHMGGTILGKTINNFQEGGMVNLPSTNKNMKYSIPNTISTSTDNSQTNHVNIHVNLNGDMKDENLGRKIGKQIQKEIRRGNLKLGK